LARIPESRQLRNRRDGGDNEPADTLDLITTPIGLCSTPPTDPTTAIAARQDTTDGRHGPLRECPFGPLPEFGFVLRRVRSTRFPVRSTGKSIASGNRRMEWSSTREASTNCPSRSRHNLRTDTSRVTIVLDSALLLLALAAKVASGADEQSADSGGDFFFSSILSGACGRCCGALPSVFTPARSAGGGLRSIAQAWRAGGDESGSPVAAGSARRKLA